MACCDISEKNTTPMHDHLKNAHKLERKMEHGKKAAQSKHQVQLQKRKRRLARMTWRLIDSTSSKQLSLSFRPVSFAVVEKQAFRNLMHKDWIPCKAESIRSNVGDNFLVTASNVKQAIQSVIDICSFRRRQRLPFLAISAKSQKKYSKLIL